MIDENIQVHCYVCVHCSRQKNFCDNIISESMNLRITGITCSSNHKPLSVNFVYTGEAIISDHLRN